MTESKPSKSERKREQHALKRLGEELLTLGDDELERLPITEALRDAVRGARSMTARGALRRQKQLIGKRMRAVDPEPIRRALQERLSSEARRKRLFADAERWREDLIEGRPTDEFEIRAGRECDELRRLLIELRHTSDPATERRLKRQLFRSIYAALEASDEAG